MSFYSPVGVHAILEHVSTAVTTPSPLLWIRQWQYGN